MTEFWEQLSPTEQAELEQVGRRRDFRRGAVIFREADRTDSVMVLRSGRVKVSVDTASGTEVVLAVRGPGALLGEFSAIDRQPRSATVTAIEADVSALALTLEEFEGFLRSHGRVAVLLMRTVVGKMR